MLKGIKYILLLSSFILSLFVNHGERNVDSFNLSNDFESDSSATQIFATSNNAFCILPQNEVVLSISQVTQKTNASNFLFKFNNHFKLVYPKFFVFLYSSDKHQIVSTFYRFILFPFHFFF
jgi:hypothetical protein